VPNIYLEGCTRDEARRYSVTIAMVFGDVLSVPPDQVHVIWRDVVTFNNGNELEGSLIVTLSWVRRSTEWFAKMVEGLTAALRADGVARQIEIEVRNKWDDAAVEGQLLSAWATANPLPSRG
jgi:hypothetical protein